MASIEYLGFGPFFSSQLELLGRPDLSPARIASEGGDCYQLCGARAPLGELSGRLRHEIGALERPVVGDWVAVKDSHHRAVIHHIFDRRTRLVRRAAGSQARGQVLAANVDVFFVVTSANRDLNERRIERYLAIIWDSGARPVVVLNKIDLSGDIDEMVQAIDSVALGVPVVRVSAVTGQGMGELRMHLGLGITTAFVGSSGVGKSSLINRLLGHQAQKIRTLRNDQKGRHATTRRELIELPDGGVLVDTPGMRELGLVEDGGGIDNIFTDVVAFAEHCRFSDCQHQGEPGCAVEEAVENSDLDAARLANYQKLHREVAAAARRKDPALAGRPKRRWKSISKQSRARSKVDPKLKR